MNVKKKKHMNRIYWLVITAPFMVSGEKKFAIYEVPYCLFQHFSVVSALSAWKEQVCKQETWLAPKEKASSYSYSKQGSRPTACHFLGSGGLDISTQRCTLFFQVFHSLLIVMVIIALNIPPFQWISLLWFFH